MILTEAKRGRSISLEHTSYVEDSRMSVEEKHVAVPSVFNAGMEANVSQGLK